MVKDKMMRNFALVGLSSSKRCIALKSKLLPLRSMAVYSLGNDCPSLDKGAWVAPNAAVIGKVKMEQGSSVWFAATLRGDNELIHVGKNSNIQDGCVVHTDLGYPVSIGERVTVGHMAMLHGCEIGDDSLIGISSTVLNGAKVGKGCLIGAHALVLENTVIPDGSLVLGSPAKVVKQLSPEQREAMKHGASTYTNKAMEFEKDLKRVD
uniref:Carbonic anhydrase n=1 Tax=Hanusia phi TaxID=3032 RepID=A0A7S0HBN1_9CRYP